MRPNLLWAAALAAPCLAQPVQAATQDPFADLPMMDRAQLAEARGGMMINGIPVNFAVVIKTTVEGAVAQGLQTVLTIGDNGNVASATTTPLGGVPVAAAANGGSQINVGGGTNILHQVVNEQVQTLIANTLNGAHVTHHTELNVELPGFSAMTQSWQGSSLAARMGRDAALSGLFR